MSKISFFNLIGYLAIWTILDGFNISNFYSWLIYIIAFGVFILISLLMERKMLVQKWWKKEFKRNIWYWVWALIINLIYVAISFGIYKGIVALFSLYQLL